MKKQRFNYERKYEHYNDYAYYGFHKVKGGRFHIDTKRLKKLDISFAFPDELFSSPRNTHYFIPKYKKASDWAFNVLDAAISHLEDDWNEEYKTVLSNIKTPKEVYENTRISGIMMTSSSDDLDQIEEDAFFARIRRERKYEEVIKSIHLQYIQKIFTEFFRAILLTIKDRGYENKEDFTFEKLCQYVQMKFNIENKRANPLFKLSHYRYLDILNKIDNFLKHNTLRSYNALANNPFEKDEELKAFQTSFVYSTKEAGMQYESGMYAGNWLKIGPEFIGDILHNLREFAFEFCGLVYNEDGTEARWNSDEALLSILCDEIIYPEW